MTKQIIDQPNQVHCSDHYDPNHPDADWSGFVTSRSGRKHIPCQPNQITPAIDGNGFGPRNDVETAEWTKPARKIVGHRESGADSDDGAEHQARSSTFSLIGGPVPADSPSKFAPECWETEAQSAARKGKTDFQPLTDNGRSMHVRGRKRSNVNSTVEARDEAKETLFKGYAPTDSSDLIGFRTMNSRVTCTDASFLREVGDAVSKLKKNRGPLTPFDPYMSASGERRKDLLVENFSSVVPGYTGKRTFIN